MNGTNPTLHVFSEQPNCCGCPGDPAGDAWEGMKFEPYGRTLAKMLGTLLKVPCEARGAGGYPWDAWDAWEGTAMARSWCVDIVGTLHLRWSGNTAVWELGRGALGHSLEGMFFFPARPDRHVPKSDANACSGGNTNIFDYLGNLIVEPSNIFHR